MVQALPRLLLAAGAHEHVTPGRPCLETCGCPGVPGGLARQRCAARYWSRSLAHSPPSARAVELLNRLQPQARGLWAARPSWTASSARPSAQEAARQDARMTHVRSSVDASPWMGWGTHRPTGHIAVELRRVWTLTPRMGGRRVLREGKYGHWPWVGAGLRATPRHPQPLADFAVALCTPWGSARRGQPLPTR